MKYSQANVVSSATTTTDIRRLSPHTSCRVQKKKPSSFVLPDMDTPEIQKCIAELCELVPSLQSQRCEGEVEVLQHVIDYIADLEVVLGDSQGSRKPLIEKQFREGVEMPPAAVC